MPLQDSNLHFDVMNIKFYLLSQEFAAGDTYVGGEGGMWWGRAGDGVGGHDVATTLPLQPADIPAHFVGHPLNCGLNYRASLQFFFF